MTQIESLEAQRKVLVEKLLTYEPNKLGKYPREYWALRGKIININKTLDTISKRVNWNNFLAK